METTEKIVEAYVRYVKGCLTMPNIKCGGQMEIDLLAIDASASRKVRRYHVETSVSISSAFSLLTNKPFSTDDLKKRVEAPGQRRTLGYFVERKVGDPRVGEKLASFGFVPGNYVRVIVSWGWQDDVPAAAEEAGVELWDFREILREIAAEYGSDHTYFTDDTLRTLQLMAMATK